MSARCPPVKTLEYSSPPRPAMSRLVTGQQHLRDADCLDRTVAPDCFVARHNQLVSIVALLARSSALGTAATDCSQRVRQSGSLRRRNARRWVVGPQDNHASAKLAAPIAKPFAIGYGSQHRGRSASGASCNCYYGKNGAEVVRVQALHSSRIEDRNIS
jgi:hypothetical protein